MHTTKEFANAPGVGFRALVPPAVLRTMRAHAVRDEPDESCGILSGRIVDGVIEVCSVLPVENVAGDPRRRFFIPANTVLAAERSAEPHGFSVIGFYHSHPRGDARPSAADIESAPPGYLYVIVAGEQVRAWLRPAPDTPFEEVAL